MIKTEDFKFDTDFTLITGACGGLGKAFVTKCAENSENLLLTGTSEKKLSALYNEISERFNNLKILTYVCDLANRENRKGLLEFISKEKITITRLINNAGVIIEGDIDRFSDEEIENAIQVNCIGTVDLTKKLLKVRDRTRKFEILTVSSIASSYPIPHMAVYAATKSFLVSMMTALSVEYKNERVVFTTVCPGGMATTQAMKDSIKSMGIGGKLSTIPVSKVAEGSLKALKRKKKIYVPGLFNKFLVFISKPFTKSFLARQSGRFYKKSQKKRNF